MNEEGLSHDHRSPPIPTARYWPWGQVGWCLFGISMCLTLIPEMGRTLGFNNIPVIDGILEVALPLVVFAAIGCSVLAFIVKRRAAKSGAVVSHLPSLRKVNFGILAAYVLPLLVTVLVPAIRQAQWAAQRTQQLETEPDSWRSYAFAGDSCFLLTPATWERAPDATLAHREIRLTDPQNDLFVVASVVPKQDVAADSLEAFQRDVVGVLQESLSEVSLGESRRAIVDGHPALVFTISGTGNGVNLVFYSQLVEYADAWVEIRLGTTRSRFTENQSLFVRIASSIHHPE